MSDHATAIAGDDHVRLVALLNRLLEAERAGAHVLRELAKDYGEDSAVRPGLLAVQRDEAANCGILIDLVRRLHGTPSAATGDFVAKALAVEGRAARLEFLNRGQDWVVRKIGEALPLAPPGPIGDALQAMRDSHVANIAACTRLIEALRGADAADGAVTP